jgi:Holliday junction resolvase RusA-like endonuclease
MNKLYRNYTERFGEIPDTIQERIQYIKNQKRWGDTDEIKLKKQIRKFKRSKYETVELLIPIVPRSCARPRFTHVGRTYVPHAAENATFFKDVMLKDNPGLPHITSPCVVYADIYEKTPESYNRIDKILYEMKLLTNTSCRDSDNLIKSILDYIQADDGRFLSDDRLVIEINANKYYSIKPRVELKIKYSV